ncbi:RdgB/HAM1 family non-canonical purine NTP pyrophosphatase [Frateuria aurantia]|uniref:dITP/XTP pyrophosphatase n=1 Tax=Frateuria aurantia (strain ATCC 33424 / DSM 6220 / KCTC 2777 / LMG 1558 / NBRC 3245 / NCIMB 13370) TaxID=767434 RepID=H8L3U3_FRAAD|nr:RdgB/HAM1 family non-canonical purine NTP pyrophosphatase [Frateuria aurantia]AFC84898.1 non-canonical purine NTP pyrophosphatase, rdgB/HAM1 family [Frateuria aurantia DSM 6220]
MQRIILASSNAGKLAEFNRLFADAGIEVLPQSAFDIPDAEETGLSFVENALLKARHASRLAGLPALADDSGLCVNALNGAPGLYSARYAGTHGDAAANNRRLLAELDAESDRSAFFICLLVLVRHPEDPAPLIAEGRWQGRILNKAEGLQGFGYDPLFLPEGQTCSAAALAPEVKNQLSHRGQALRRLRRQWIDDVA